MGRKKGKVAVECVCARGEEDGMDKKRKAVSPGGEMAFAHVAKRDGAFGVGKAV